MKNSKELSQRAFDRQADTYDNTNLSRHARQLHPLLLAQLGEIPRGSVLDVGCGTGALLDQVSRRWPDTRCAGVDLSPNMTAIAGKRLSGRAEIRTGDAESLPFPSGSFEALLCCDSFHHYPHPHLALAEFHRVLTASGVLLLADATAPWGVRSVFNLFLPLSREGDVRLYGSKELASLLSSHFHGVRCQSVSSTSLFAWGIK